MTIKYTSKLVRVFGYACVVLAVNNTALDLYGRWTGAHGFNPGVGMGIMAIALVGLLAFVVSQCLKNVEARLAPERLNNN